MTYIPEWPGDVTGAKCLSCMTKERWCEKKVRTGKDNCVELHTRRYKRKCENEIDKHDFPKDRRGKPLKPKSKRCERIIQLGLDLTETDTTTDPLTRKRLQAEARKCKKQLAKECIAEFKEDHPESSMTEGGSFWVAVKEFFGVNVEREKSIRWGASTGYVTACEQAAAVAATVCAEQKTACQVEMDPDRHCR